MTAIDIIDKLSDKLAELNLNDTEGITIEKDILDKINSDFQGFIAQKQNMIFNLKEMQKTFISQFEDLNMPNLSIYLNSRYASLQNQNGYAMYVMSHLQRNHNSQFIRKSIL